jgi:putative ABC transport system ATP-binding protein
MTSPHTLTTQVTRDALRATDLEVSYGEVVALRDISLTLEPGDFLAVTGPSGAGKTSLLWVLAAALRPAAGEVQLGTHTLNNREQAAALGVALVPQGNGLVGSLTGAENVLAPLLARGMPPSDARNRTTCARHRCLARGGRPRRNRRHGDARSRGR